MRAREFIEDHQDSAVNEALPLLPMLGALGKAAGGTLIRKAGSAMTNVAGNALKNIAGNLASNVATGAAKNVAADVLGGLLSGDKKTEQPSSAQSAKINPADITKLAGKEVDTGSPDLGKIKVGAPNPQGVEIKLSNPNTKIGQVLGPKFILPTK